MESISFRVMTKQTASQAIYSFIPSYRRAPRHCLCLFSYPTVPSTSAYLDNRVAIYVWIFGPSLF
jgi:hypothetical protein